MQQLIWRGIGDGSREDPFVLQIPKGARFDRKDAFNIYFETNYIGFKHSESYIKVENRHELYLIGSLIELNGTLLIKMKNGIEKTLFLSEFVNAVDGVYYLTQVEGVDYVLKQQSYSIYEVDDFDLEVELEGLETDTVIVTADKIKGSKFTLSADVKINTLENELLVKTEDGLYVKRDDTKLNAKPDGTNDLIVDDKVNPEYLPDVTGLVNIDGVTIVNNDDNELAVAPTIITKLEGIEEGAQVNPYDKATLDSWKTNIDDNTADIADLETNKATAQDIINLISLHNNDTEAHSYILRLIATVQAGIAKALVFDTNAQLETWLTDRTIIHQGYLPEELLLGQGIYTLPENEVDYWVSKLPVNTAADLTPLHGKIDLSNYALLTDLSALRTDLLILIADKLNTKPNGEIPLIDGNDKIDNKYIPMVIGPLHGIDFGLADESEYHHLSSIHMDESGRLHIYKYNNIDPDNNQQGEIATLDTAVSVVNQLEATPEMTERVGINADGQLVIKPAETSGGEEFSLYKDYASDIYYDAKATDAQFNSAWEHSLTVDIPNNAAYPNADVDGIIIPMLVTEIGDNAFSYWQTNNQLLIIPNSVTSIGNNVFEGWHTVPYVVMTRLTPPTLANSNAFSDQNNAPIYVPNASLNDYKTATNWVALASRIKPISELRFD